MHVCTVCIHICLANGHVYISVSGNSGAAPHWMKVQHGTFFFCNFVKIQDVLSDWKQNSISGHGFCLCFITVVRAA